jgi:hypothetical protein
LLDQLDRACISVLLNTAEGNGKRQGLQRARRIPGSRGWNQRLIGLEVAIGLSPGWSAAEPWVDAQKSPGFRAGARAGHPISQHALARLQESPQGEEPSSARPRKLLRRRGDSAKYPLRRLSPWLADPLPWLRLARVQGIQEAVSRDDPRADNV